MKIGRYVRQTADSLGLRDWTFTIEHEEPDNPEAEAECRVVYGQRHAVLRFKSCFYEHDPELQRHVVVHELFHVHLDPMRRVICNVESHLGQPVWQLFHESFKDSLEDACDNLAAAATPAVPLPESLRV